MNTKLKKQIDVEIPLEYGYCGQCLGFLRKFNKGYGVFADFDNFII